MNVRSGATSGSCFSQSFGGQCSGTPEECEDCNKVNIFVYNNSNFLLWLCIIQALNCENVMNEENEAAESNGVEVSGC